MNKEILSEWPQNTKLSGMTMDDLDAEHARCVAGGWTAEAGRIRAEIGRRIKAAGEATHAAAAGGASDAP